MTALYARYTAQTVQEAAQQLQEQHRRVRARDEVPRQQYPALPWQMEDLPGTTWRNVYTASIHTVQRLDENRFGKIGPDPDKWTNSMFEIGLWVGDRFCIDHWVRVDHLSPKVQVDWARERVAYCRQRLARQYESLERVKQGKSGGSVSYRKQVITRHKKYVDQARRELQDIAAQLHVPLTVNILNIGVQPGQQMILI